MTGLKDFASKRFEAASKGLILHYGAEFNKTNLKKYLKETKNEDFFSFFMDEHCRETERVWIFDGSVKAPKIVTSVDQVDEEEFQLIDQDSWIPILDTTDMSRHKLMFKWSIVDYAIASYKRCDVFTTPAWHKLKHDSSLDRFNCGYTKAQSDVLNIARQTKLKGELDEYALGKFIELGGGSAEFAMEIQAM